MMLLTLFIHRLTKTMALIDHSGGRSDIELVYKHRNNNVHSDTVNMKNDQSKVSVGFKSKVRFYIAMIL